MTAAGEPRDRGRRAADMINLDEETDDLRNYLKLRREPSTVNKSMTLLPENQLVDLQEESGCLSTAIFWGVVSHP